MRTPGSVQSLLYPLVKRWYIIVICVAISAVIASRYLYVATPQYQASASVRIEDSREGQSNNGLYRDFDVMRANPRAATEVEVLKSRSLFETALERLDFNVEYYRDGDMTRQEVYKETPILVDYSISDKGFQKREFCFQAGEGNSFRISYEAFGVRMEKSGEYGQPICDKGLCVTVTKNEELLKYRSGMLNEPWFFTVYSKEALAAKLMGPNYIVKAVDKDVNILRLYYSHPIPEKAMRMTNAIAEAYIQQGIADRQDMASSTVDFINQQIVIVGNELQSARDAIKTYRVNNEIINIPQETEVTYKTLGGLEVQRVDVNMQLSVLESMSDYLRRNKEIKLTGPEFGTITDPLFTESVSRLNTKLREKDDLLRKFTPENERVKTAENDIQQQKAYLMEAISNTRRKLILKMDEITFAIDQQKSTFKGLPEKESTLQELNRNYFLYEKVYNFLIEKRTEAIIARQVDFSFNRVLESAVLPAEPVSPRKDVVWSIALLLGFVCGVILAYFRHYSKPVVDTPEDLSPESEIPVIGHIQQFGKNDTAYRNFTALSTRILMNKPDAKNMVITVTSTRKGEGKSFVASQLARTLAAQDKKVILLDLNTYSPRLAEWFDARTDHGISEVYTHRSALQDAIQLTSIPNLDVITAGSSEQPIGHLLSTSRTREILDELRSHYDAVIIDTPEVGEHIDAIPFMKWSDLNLYVVRADSGRSELVANAELVKEEYRLQEVHFVLNAMKQKRNHTGYISTSKIRQVRKKKSMPQLTNLFMW